ncbi:MAG: response regulator [Zetaproteobacteria bacterium]|nr:response regulator [Zetaproteobacteria bacterium]
MLTSSVQDRVLVVDDNATNRQIFEMMLESSGWDVVIFPSGAEALHYLRQHRASLLLIDVHMPVMTGFELAKEIKKDPIHDNTPILFITAGDHNEIYVEQGFDIGAFDFLIKPISKQILINKIRVFLHLHHQQTALAEANRYLGSHLHKVTEHMSDGLMTIDKEGVIKTSNPALLELLGYENGELSNRTMESLIDDEHIEPFSSRVFKSAAEKLQKQFNSDKSRAFANMEKAPISLILVDQTGNIVCANRHAEATFQFERDGLKNQPITQLMPASIRPQHDEYFSYFFSNPSDRPMGLGRAFISERSNGDSFDSEIGLMYVSIDDEPYALAVIRDIHRDISWHVLSATGYGGLLTANGGEEYMLSHLHRKDGSRISVILSGSSMFDNDNNLIGAAIFVTDMEKHINLLQENQRIMGELEKAQHERLESLGLLAGGVAHDFNNLLTPIIGNLEMIARKVPVLEVNKLVKDALSAAKQASRLSKQMLSYAGSGRIASTTITLNDLIEPIESVLSASAEKAHVDFKLDPNLPPADLDIAEIEQVLLNMVVNASDAIHHVNGRITVSTFTHMIDEQYLDRSRHKLDANCGRYVAFRVEDNGSGMSEHVLSKIFDPFFTTKFTGRGLGMSAVLGIIKHHHGVLKIDSIEGQGSIMTASFPISNKSIQVHHHENSDDEHNISGNILIVDDDELVNRILQARLEDIGFTSIQAFSGMEALEIYANEHRNIDAVILDMTMPMMSGAECFEKILAMNPQAKVIISSGYAQADIQSEFPKTPPSAFLEKPYESHQLIRVLKQILA